MAKEIKFVFRSDDSTLDTSVYQIKAKLKGQPWVGDAANEILLTPDPVTGIPTSNAVLIGTIADAQTTFKIRVKIIQRAGENFESNEQHFIINNVPVPPTLVPIFTLDLSVGPFDCIASSDTEIDINTIAEFRPGSTIIIGAGMP